METRAILTAVASVLLLASCAPQTPREHGGGHGESARAKEERLTIKDVSSPTEVSFQIEDGKDTLQDYGVSHTKEMHLIIVRDDLQNFHHLHPERDVQGTWSIPFTPPAGGTYWLYADFVDRQKSPHTIRFERTYEIAPGPYGIKENSETVKEVGGYRIALKTEKHGSEISFTYSITDAAGVPVALEEYLGARGHSVLISPSGDFIHTHPSTSSGQVSEEEGELPTFITKLPAGSFHRMFTQFRIQGEVLTVSFDWET